MRDCYKESIFDGVNLEEHIRNRLIGVWGTGKSSKNISNVICKVNRFDFSFFDNAVEKQGTIYQGKKILSPKIIDKNWYIFVCSNYYEEISKQLRTYGLREVHDYIDAKEIDFYIFREKYKDAPKVPRITSSVLREIEEQLYQLPIEIVTIDWMNSNLFLKFEEKLGFQDIYGKGKNKRYKRKIEEYYIVDKILGFDEYKKGDKYIDVGACSSPYVINLRNRGIEAYAVDLDESLYKYDYYIQEDATHTSFFDNSIKGISAQSSFEMFVGNADIELIKEIARVLVKGGKAVILPLYLHKQYLSTVSPIYYNSGNADEDSVECIRTDCGNAIYLSRFYDVKHLKERIIDTAKRMGLECKIYILPNEWVECDDFVYMKYILELIKN